MQDSPDYAALESYPAPRRSWRGALFGGLIAFLLGAALVGWLAWEGYLGAIVPQSPSRIARTEQAAQTPVAADDVANLGISGEEASESVGTVEARLAMVEDRLSRLDLQADAASGNAARAESLLIAFAVRRMIDRGEPLRYLADQLRLRFADAQPRAVETIVAFAAKPVTLDELNARLEALRPQLMGDDDNANLWDRARRELTGIFTVRREASAVLSPESRFDRAGVMLTAGRIPEAIDSVERMPGSDAANRWVADAKRYAAAQKALDLIETTAMLEPTRLNDAEGNRVEQPSPLAQPTARPLPAEPAEESGF